MFPMNGMIPPPTFLPLMHMSVTIPMPSMKQKKGQVRVNPKRQRERWEYLASRNVRHRGNSDNFCPSSLKQGNDGEENDPYDCSNLMDDFNVQKIIANEIKCGVKEWKALNERRIVRTENSNDSEKARRPGRTASEFVFLPHKFDFRNELSSPPTFEDIDNSRHDKVVDIMNPGSELYYETELWKIFKKVRHLENVEKELACKLDEAEKAVYRKTSKKSASRLVKQELDKVSSSRTFNITDAHSSCRIRNKNLHHFPSVGSAQIEHGKRFSYVSSNNSLCSDNDVSDVEASRGDRESGNNSFTSAIVNCVVRIECMKRQYCRGVSHDHGRLEMDFLGHQTLLDVHNYITSQSRAGNKSIADVDSILDLKSGLFFIENVFYVAGSEDYSKQILEWLNEKDEDGFIAPRHRALGISKRDLLGCVRQMKDMQLQDISFRLGVRYVHFMHGDVQTNFFFTCIRPAMNGEIIPYDSYPVTLDSWSTKRSFSSVCDACSMRGASAVCVDDELTDGGPKLFCAMCYHFLHYNKGAQISYKNFRVYPLELFSKESFSCSEVPNDVWFLPWLNEQTSIKSKT
mmetsp:Transcript_16579/g.21571  ORF Transcript_16579/g.21571 Transcript_16579/m.21571 type:complete len:573 (-) Transcript_16579:252-1970(-)|eukprot:CAMPEP_0116068294 /NCGR_PEP_ID=MMETSP0322-20121206/11569_1 /TAXON_ID=163516 /ORGANISM="Leptocylindrus danicus var. apora, Strain B651" /LENGTH=572 /DNA_ID=CAMNT_0003555365 /DNA_START=23 /DNA_END=1741 /DNA_ORIENTATION=+